MLIFPRLFSLSTQQNFIVADMEFWDGSVWHCDFKWRRSLFQWEITLVSELFNLIGAISPSVTLSDKLLWIPDTSNGYNVKSFTEIAANKMFNKILPTQIVDFVWQKVAPPRAQMVVWFLARDRLKVGSYLSNIGVISTENARCPFCYAHIETSSHLFFTFEFTWSI